MKREFLLIDDDADEVILLREALYHSVIGCCCEWVQSVEIALAMLERHIPDLILIDYNMPRINGITGVKMIRSMPRLKKVPIIFYSTSIDEKTKKLALDAGADLVIQKQFNTQGLVKLLSEFLNTRFLLNEKQN